MFGRCFVFVVVALFACSCGPTEAPATREHVVLKGNAYERGLQHGEQLGSKVKSFHSTLVTTTLLPYLNREQHGIAEFLPEYRKEKYANGKFSRALLLDNARELERSMSRALKDELQGISDGSGLPYEDVLVLNTFVDTVLSVRAIAYALKLSQAPRILKVEIAGADLDGLDNDEDGTIDEAGEGVLDPYEPMRFATFSGISSGAQLKLLLMDADGVDPATVRVQAGSRILTVADGVTATVVDAQHLEVTLTLPTEAELNGALVLSVSAGDLAIVETPPPAHANFMREERIAFALRGSGKQRGDVVNAGVQDSRSQPTSISFAVRGTQSEDGNVIVGQNFGLLDANTAHKHTAVIEHRPTEGGVPHITVGWAGVTWGFAGLNDEGLAAVCNPSDTLDNAVVERFIEQVGDLDNAKLLTRGRALGFNLRRILQSAKTVQAAEDELRAQAHPFGWSCLFTDDTKALRAVELDADFSNDGIFSFGPELEENGRKVASNSPDDLRLGAHFTANVDDMFTLAVAGQRITPQRYWSSNYFRSVQATAAVGSLLAARSPLSVEEAKSLLADPRVEDARDSMYSVVIDPAARTLNVSQGAVPATSAGFVEVGFSP